MKILKGTLIIYALAIFGAGIYFLETTSDETHLSQLSSFLPGTTISSLPTGTLIRSTQDDKVYYIENGVKRWIDSAETFRVQGFKAEEIRNISYSEVSQITTGENITKQSNIILPKEAQILPDLAPLAIRDLRLSTVAERKVLRFTSLFWNQGARDFELISGLSTAAVLPEGYSEVFQHIAAEDGTFRNKVVGSFYWHGLHAHYHYSDFANYVFTLVKPVSDIDLSSVPSIRQKTTFCLRDNDLISVDLPGASYLKTYSLCGKTRQGVSIGWADRYDSTLPDQYIDIQDMPAGVYSLSFYLDPNQRFVETRKDNNISTVLLDLNPALGTIKVIASVAPFRTSLNTFAHQTIVRAGGKGEIYIIHNNKKRWLRTAELFNSYGYDWDSIYILAESLLDAIPFNNLIRVQGREEVYAINDLGYKRHILNPTVFSSYQFTGPDVADINETEFASYPSTSLIRVVGDGDIYLINGATKKKLGRIDYIQSLGYDLNSIHTVNPIDFNAYVTVP